MIYTIMFQIVYSMAELHSVYDVKWQHKNWENNYASYEFDPYIMTLLAPFVTHSGILTSHAVDQFQLCYRVY
jgi:hypothetical protein